MTQPPPPLHIEDTSSPDWDPLLWAACSGGTPPATYIGARAVMPPHIVLEMSGAAPPPPDKPATIALTLAHARALRDWLTLALEAMDP